MSLRTENLDDLVRRAKGLAEAVLDTEAWDSAVRQEARDLLSRITVHEAIHEDPPEPLGLPLLDEASAVMAAADLFARKMRPRQPRPVSDLLRMLDDLILAARRLRAVTNKGTDEPV